MDAGNEKRAQAPAGVTATGCIHGLYILVLGYVLAIVCMHETLEHDMLTDCRGFETRSGNGQPTLRLGTQPYSWMRVMQSSMKW